MENIDIETVLNFLQGIGSGEANVVIRQIDQEKYIEHSARNSSSPKGLREFVIKASQKEHHLNVIRAFRDGAYVFTQSEGALLGQNVFFDLFRFDRGLIVEHWVISTKAAPPNQSGHTQTDGPTEAILTEDTEKNKALVQEYYETIHVDGDHSKTSQYFDGDSCIRHEPSARDGVLAFRQDLENLVKDRTIDSIKFVLGRGDFVFVLAKGTHRGDPCAYVDLYRVKAAKIVERWGFSQQLEGSFDL